MKKVITHNTTRTVADAPASSDYQARLVTPFAVLGVRTDEDWLTDIEYLPLDTPPLAPRNPLAREVCEQLECYLDRPDFVFDLPLHIGGTIHQRRVWQTIQSIAPGSTLSYADIAARLHSAPRAIGQACGANRLPVVIPCHRVISKNGGLGGFMHASDGDPLAIKRWLLQHEHG